MGGTGGRGGVATKKKTALCIHIFLFFCKDVSPMVPALNLRILVVAVIHAPARTAAPHPLRTLHVLLYVGLNLTNPQNIIEIGAGKVMTLPNERTSAATGRQQAAAVRGPKPPPCLRAHFSACVHELLVCHPPVVIIEFKSFKQPYAVAIQRMKRHNQHERCAERGFDS